MGKIGLGLTHDEVFFNGRSKYYTDRNGNKQWLETIVASKAIFNPTKVEASDTEWSKELYCGKCEKQEDEVTSTTQASSVRAARRAAKKVFEIALCTYEDRKSVV